MFKKLNSKAIQLATVILAVIVVAGLSMTVVYGRVFLTVDTNDGLLDSGWSATPPVTDPLGDTTWQDWSDITGAWFGLDRPVPADYFFRIEVGSGPIDNGGTAHIELDCNRNRSFADEAIDRVIHYWVGYDHPADGLEAVWVTSPAGTRIATYTDDYGEVAAETNYELRAHASDLGLCATLPFGIRFSTNFGADVTGPISTPIYITVEPIGGGSLVYTATDGLTTTVEVPPYAVTETTTIAFAAVSTVTAPSGFSFAGRAFDLEAYRQDLPLPALAFSVPVTVTIHYADTDVVLMDESQLLLQTWNATAGLWEDAACGEVDRRPSANSLAVPICHLGRFALFGRVHTVVLPLMLRNMP